MSTKPDTTRQAHIARQFLEINRVSYLKVWCPQCGASHASVDLTVKARWVGDINAVSHELGFFLALQAWCEQYLRSIFTHNMLKDTGCA